MKALLLDFLRAANESPAALAIGALLGIGGAAVLAGCVIALAAICHTGL
jgi:hypothetical protein